MFYGPGTYNEQKPTTEPRYAGLETFTYDQDKRCMRGFFGSEEPHHTIGMPLSDWGNRKFSLKESARSGSAATFRTSIQLVMNTLGWRGMKLA
jgi:hypothetical protein